MNKKPNPQPSKFLVLFAAFVAAMILPLAMLGYSTIQEIRHKEVSKGAKSVVDNLRQSLEVAADTKLGKEAETATLMESISLPVANPSTEAEKIQAFLSIIGGDIIYHETLASGDIRLVIRIPGEQESTLKSHLSIQEEVQNTSIGDIQPVAKSQEAQKTLEVILQSPSDK